MPDSKLDLHPTPFLPPAMVNIDMDVLPTLFKGDFFGDYPGNFFNDTGGDGSDFSDFSSNEEDEEPIEDSGWEPLVAASPGPAAATNSLSSKLSHPSPLLPLIEQ